MYFTKDIEYGTTCGWVNNSKIFLFTWTFPDQKVQRSGNKISLSGDLSAWATREKEKQLCSWCLNKCKNQLSGQTTRYNSTLIRRTEFFWDFDYQVSFVTRIMMVLYTRGMKWLCDNPQSHWPTGIESGSVVCARVFVWAFISSWSFLMVHYHSQDATERDTDGAQGINDDLIEHHLDEFTRPENTCKQWFTLIKKAVKL